jgi:hypothetical protein
MSAALVTYDLADTHPQLVPDGCVATVALYSEDAPPDGYFASGDDEQDADDVAAIYRALDYTEWAWCTVCVTVTDGDAEGAAWLGCVSRYTVLTRASGDTFYSGRDALADFMQDAGVDVLDEAVAQYHEDRARLVAKYAEAAA